MDDHGAAGAPPSFAHIAQTLTAQRRVAKRQRRGRIPRGDLANSGGDRLRPLIENLRGFVNKGGPYDAQGRAVFSKSQRQELRQLLPSDEAVLVIEAECALADYRATADHAHSARNVRDLMRRDGVKLPRGKQPLAHRIALVEGIVPILLWYGVPFASGTDSKLVEVLRAVAKSLGFTHDPREQLRGLLRKERLLEVARQHALQHALPRLAAAFAAGLRPVRPD